jgi:hypothetical protein
MSAVLTRIAASFTVSVSHKLIHSLDAIDPTSINGLQARVIYPSKQLVFFSIPVTRVRCRVICSMTMSTLSAVVKDGFRQEIPLVVETANVETTAYVAGAISAGALAYVIIVLILIVTIRNRRYRATVDGGDTQQ